MRIFIALEPDRVFLESLLTCIEPLKQKYPGLRWVPVVNLHITLAFLGDTEPACLPLITAAVKNAVDKHADSGIIQAAGDRLFTLPARKPANVLAMGFSRGGDRMAALARDIKMSLEAGGILLSERDRDFLPHLTLARKGKTPITIDKEDSSISTNGDIIKAVVFESVLKPRGAVYKELAVFRLGTVSSI